MKDQGGLGDLSVVADRIPHYEFLMELLTERERCHRWTSHRVARFEKVKRLILACWEHMQALARQMRYDEHVKQLFAAMKHVVDQIRAVERFIREAPPRRGLFQFMVMPAGQGVLLN